MVKTINNEGDSENKLVGHIFQYQIWKKSLDAVYLVYLFLVIAMAILLQIFCLDLIQEQNFVLDQKAVIDALLGQTQTTAIIEQLELAYVVQNDISSEYYKFFDVAITLNILTIGYFVQDILEIVYSSLRKVHVKTYTLSVMLNLTSTITIFIWIIKHYGDYSSGLGEYREEVRASVIISRMQDDNDFNIKFVLAILLAIQYIRLVLALQVSRTFGPMVKILTSMIVDVAIFLFLFVAMFFIFAGAGELLFEELDEYKDIVESLKTLFSSCLGEFEYETYDELKSVNPHVGYVFITVFLIIISIMLLNFLIAILSNTYELLNDVKNGLYLKNVIYLRQKYNYDRIYSSLVYANTPFNLFMLILLPFVIYFKSKKLNKMILMVEYFGVGFYGVVIFLASSLAM